MKKLMSLTALSKKFGRPDTERIGIFIEMPYLPVRAKVKKKDNKKKKPEPEEEYSTRGMYPGGPKSKCGNQDGYFEDSFKRIFRGEGPGRTKKRSKGKSEALIPFIPAGPSKKPTGRGDYHGTFAGMWDSFSPTTRRKPKRKSEKPNPVTNPVKKGGPGYANICIERYPEHSEGMPRKPKKPKKLTTGPLITAHYTKSFFLRNPYIDPKVDVPDKKWYNKKEERIILSKAVSGRPIFVPTGPAKWMGGCKDGTISKFPPWKKEPYLSYLKMKAALNGPKIPFVRGEFYPQVYGFKTMYTFSTLHNTSYSLNITNWKNYQPTYVKRLVKNILI